MIVIPAIDLKGGRCVRLAQGRADDEKVYSEDPAAMARRWVEAGAERLHVVDLDGAFEGAPVHGDAIESIVRAVDVPVEVGGGLRTDADIEATLGRGVRNAVIGTRAIAEQAELRRLVERFGNRLWVGIDARDGFVQVKGWVETTQLHATELAAKIAAAGVSTLIYTDTATDGMMGGVNLAATREICEAVGCRVIASGGVSSTADIVALRTLSCANLAGAIVGRALYENAVSLESLISAAREGG